MLDTAIKSASPVAPAPILLDPACGTGLVTIPAVQHLPGDATIIGIDISTDMLHEARTKLSGLPVHDQERVTLMEHDMENYQSLPTVAELECEVDMITCASTFVVVRGVQNRRDALREWSRLLKLGAEGLVFDVTHKHNVRSRVVMERVLEALDCKGSLERSWILRRGTSCGFGGKDEGCGACECGTKRADR